MLWFIGSCAVVVAIIVLEVANYSRSNDDLQSSTYLLLILSLVAGLLGIINACVDKSVVRVVAVVVGLLPVELLALLVYEISDSFSRQTSYEQPEAMTREDWQEVKRREEMIRTHPYTGRDSIEPYYTAEQMPSLTGKPEYQPDPSKSYVELGRLLSRRATPTLDSAQPRPDTVFVSFTVGPYGGIFQEQIQYRNTPKSAAHKQAEEAVLLAVHDVPRLHPGRINGKPVSVRIHVAVPLPGP
ncbi:hypothetical protein K3G63_04170 [Hymenobacter sp. HSC-4F20]|uniref:hypothetical protein n=1 Tax=Hymenobacter sp. HSC-4F20 TaxID=2864135 RepID=UPI001C73B4B3|nr:hypothetical protein [Hymenobacter sp. HSC-4F20]MBX0289619.1 hypothetical protein [Hymenobacter sp. HSC-4F20]